MLAPRGGPLFVFVSLPFADYVNGDSTMRQFLTLRAVLIPCLIALVAAMAPMVSSAAEMDIVDTAVAAGSFKTLVAAAKAAGLVDTLKGKGPYTVFAPTDEAFAKLPTGTVENLLKPENKQKLADLLKYHVVAGKVMAEDVVKLTEAKTLQGQSAKVKVTGGNVMIDGAHVVKTDIGTTNGVIHVIDAVIMPK